MRTRLAALALVASLAAVAGAAEPRPDWLSGESREFPRAAYLTGVGEGETQEKSADKARAEIAKALGTQVTAATSVTARESSGKGASFSQEVVDDVRTYTAKVLEGVEVPHYWVDEKGEHHALAVLDRAKSVEMLKDKIREYDGKIAHWAESLPDAEGKFARLKAALQLLNAAKSRRKLNGDLRVLSPEGKGIPPPAGYEAAQSQARKAIKAVTVQISASGEAAPIVASRLIDGLTARGLRVVEKGPGAADILVKAAASAEILPAENLMWQWARGSLQVRMSYGATGEVFSRFEESGQESGGDADSAAEGALKALAERAAVRAYQVVLSRELEDD